MASSVCRRAGSTRGIRTRTRRRGAGTDQFATPYGEEATPDWGWPLTGTGDTQLVVWSRTVWAESRALDRTSSAAA